MPQEIVFSAIYSERHGELPIEEQLREAQRALELERMITQLQEANAEIARLQRGRSSPRSRRSPPRSQRSTPQSGLRDEDGDCGNDSSGENSVESAIESIRSQLTQKSIAQSMVDATTPKDQKRFKSDPVMGTAMKILSDQLIKKKVNEENWLSWSLLFGQLLDLLEIREYVFDGKPQPVTQGLLVTMMCGGDQNIYAERIAPFLKFDLFGM